MMQGYSTNLELKQKTLADGETQLMRALEYRVWIRAEKFEVLKESLEELWEVYNKHTKPTPPLFLVKRLGRFA
jgi:hypothetical protein